MFDDLKNMRFKEILWVNCIRGVAAGVVWMVVMLIARPPEMHLGMAFAYPSDALSVDNYYTDLLGFFQLADLFRRPVHGVGPLYSRLIGSAG